MNENGESILNSVKELLGIKDMSITAFDTDIILNINAAIAVLTQIGIGPSAGFQITGPSETYRDFLGDPSKFQLVPMYLYYKTRLGFDPPQSSAVMECLKQMIKETEYRLNAQVDPPDTFE